MRAVLFGCLIWISATGPGSSQPSRTGPCPAAWNATGKLTAEEFRTGPERRVEVAQCGDAAVQRNARAAVAILRKQGDPDEDAAAGRITLNTVTHGTRPRRVSLGSGQTVETLMCASDRFRQQEEYSFCSGVLVSPSAVLTAAHCVERLDDGHRRGPRDLLVLFDLREGSLPQGPLAAADPRVRRVLWAVAFKSAEGADGTSHDLAVIRLGSPVTDREPAVLPRAGRDPVAPDRSVYALGHPNGLPMKLSPGGAVTGAADPVFFETDLPLFNGNSGGPVFDAATHEVLGVLSRGPEFDWFYDPRGDCATSRCGAAADSASACAGRDKVTRLSAVPGWMRRLLDIGAQSEAKPDEK